MSAEPELEGLRRREAPLALRPDEFRQLGHRLVDEIAGRLERLAEGPVRPDVTPADVRRALGADAGLPRAGCDAGRLLAEATELLFDHSLFNAHPRFFGYITASPAPIGVLGELLAAALNQNVGAFALSPLATEIERQTVRWIAELIGLPATGGGLLVSGGNMANLVGLLAARAQRVPWDVRKRGLGRQGPALLVYASVETHTWLQKAADLSGLGTDAIRWVAADDQQRMKPAALRRQIEQDRGLGHRPLLVVATAGSVATGAVDPLPEIAAVCRDHDLWLHVDGAYGAFAAQVPGAPECLWGLADADSIAVDPHKWLYAPLEAGCVLVRDASVLRDAFSYHPAYYHFDEEALNYFDYGPQNSRGFRALKVWLALRQVGRAGYLRMIGDDMALARHLHRLAAEHPEFEAATQGLSVTTFRYVPVELRAQRGGAQVERYLDQLNQEILTRVEKGGEAFLSNAVVDGRFLLRACIVNFHTALGDVEALLPLVARIGRETDQALRAQARASVPVG